MLTRREFKLDSIGLRFCHGYGPGKRRGRPFGYELFEKALVGEPYKVLYGDVSQVAADILERSLKERAETAGLGLLGPAVEGVVKREVGRMSDRLAHLIARTALKSATARRLVFQLLVRQLITDGARRLNQAAWTGSVDSLRTPSEGLWEILGSATRSEQP